MLPPFLPSRNSCSTSRAPRVHQAAKKGAPCGAPCGLVDPRGIEPLSENPFTEPSTWIAYDLKFPLGGGHKHPPPAGSPFLHDRYKCELPMHVHHCMTLSPWSWSSSGERAAKKPRHCLIRQPLRQYCQRLILKIEPSS